MLKAAKASYSSFDTEEIDYDNWSDSDMRPELCAILKMTDEELPMKGSIADWLQLIDKVQKERGARVLTRAQRSTMESFCIDANMQVEMYAFDIYKLLELVWSTTPAADKSIQKGQKPENTSSSSLLDSRQRSSKPLSQGPTKPKNLAKRMDETEPDDEGDVAASSSEGHPSISSVSSTSFADNVQYEDRINLRSRPSAISGKRSQSSALPPRPNLTADRRSSWRDPRLHSEEAELQDEDVNKVQPSPSLSETYTRESYSRRKLREAERRLDIATKEYTERIMQLERDLSAMKQEITTHKKTIAEYKVQEEYRLAQINELEKRIEENNRKQNNQKHLCDELKQQIAAKNEELSRLQSLLDETQETLKLAETRFDQLQQELASQERDRHWIAELQARLQEELRTNEDFKKQLEEQQAENEELKDIIDAIKFELDEARAERAQEERTVMTLRAEIANANEKRNEEIEAQLRPKLQEALEAVEKMEKLKTERDDYKEQVVIALEEAIQERLQNSQLEEENKNLRQDIKAMHALRELQSMRRDESTQTINEIGVQCDIQVSTECAKCANQQGSSEVLEYNLKTEAGVIHNIDEKLDGGNSDYDDLVDLLEMLLGKTWSSFFFRMMVLVMGVGIISNLFCIVDDILKQEPLSIGVEDVPLESLYPYYNLVRRPKNRLMDGLLYWLEQKLYSPDQFVPLT